MTERAGAPREVDAGTDAELRPRAGPEPDAEGAEIAEAARTRKFRHAAFVYLHVGILYEAAVYVVWRSGGLPAERGPIWLWLLFGAAIVAVVFWGLWSWRNRWFARAVWALHALRVPWAVEGLILPVADLALPRSAYALALPVILINLAFLARAGWDL